MPIQKMPEQKKKQELTEALMGNMDMDSLWTALTAFADDTYTTAKGLKFTYQVKGYEIFVDRKEKSITRSSVEIAFQKVLEIGNGCLPAVVSGPKKLGVFGASYLYPVFIRLGIILREQQVLELE